MRRMDWRSDWRSAALWLLGVPTLSTGLWAGLAPHSWFQDFPGFGHHWLVDIGEPYSEHLVRDLGFGLAALGLLTLWAAVRPGVRLLDALPVALLLFGAPHLVFHIVHADRLSAGDNAANLALLAGAVVIPLALLVAGPRPAPRAPSVPPGGRIPGRRAGSMDLALRLIYRVVRRRFRRVIAPVAVTAHQRQVLTGYLAYELALERADSVDPRLEGLAATKAASLTGCPFCLDYASALLPRLGVSERQLRDLPRYRQSGSFSPLEKLVLEYAEAMTRTPVQVPDELFAQLREHFDDEQIVELTAAIAFENYRGRFNHALGIRSQGFCGDGFCALPEGDGAGPAEQLTATP